MNANLKTELELQKITPRTPIGIGIGIVMGRDKFYGRRPRPYSFLTVFLVINEN